MRYAVRMLLRNPGFSALAVISLALGIGANTLMFSIVNAVLLRSLPYPDSDRLVFIWFTPPNHPEQKRAATISNFLALEEQSKVLEHVGTIGGVDSNASVSISPADPPEQIGCQRFSAQVPLALGAKPILGRWFTESESEKDSSRVIVISYSFWQYRLARDANVLGRIIRVDGQPTTIIGVMPEGWMMFNYPAQFWEPYRISRSGQGTILPLGRIKVGVTFQQAQHEMNRFAAGLAEVQPSTNKGWGIRLEPALDVYVGWVRKPLIIVQGVVAFVLLIACANVAGLFLAQASDRRAEVALRAALGASRWRIVRQFLNESALLASIGGLLGLLLVVGGLRLFIAISPSWFPRVAEISLDMQTLVFTALLSLATAFLFGTVPALSSSRPDLIGTIKAAAAPVRQRVHSAIVVFEISAALVLLTGAGLMINTFVRLYTAPLGYDIRDILTFQVNLPAQEIVEQVREHISAFSQVNSVATAVRAPLSEGSLNSLIRGVSVDQTSRTAVWFPVSSGYFQTLRIPIVRGRSFTNRDTSNSQPVAVINETMARQVWPGQDPVGHSVKLDGTGERNRQIVGVAADVRHDRSDTHSLPQVYVPTVQYPSVLEMTFLVRAPLPHASLVAAIRAVVSNVSGNVPIFSVKTLDDYAAEQLWQPRQTTVLLAIFGAIAIMLAMSGVYGIIAYAIRLRTREIGIRIALGATRKDVLQLVLLRGLLLVALGATIGFAASFSLTRFLASQLWGVTATDIPTYAAAILTLFCLALIACYIPSRRAMRIEPLIALRHE